MTLNARAWLALDVVTAVMGALPFGAAGTMRYWPAWVSVVPFFAASIFTSMCSPTKEGLKESTSHVTRDDVARARGLLGRCPRGSHQCYRAGTRAAHGAGLVLL